VRVHCVRCENGICSNTGAWYNTLKLTELNVTGSGHRGRVLASDADAMFRDSIDVLLNTTLREFRGVVLFRSITPGHTHGCKATASVDFGWHTFDERNQLRAK
jgi:hypothetical protein